MITSFPQIPELLQVAKHVVWFKKPEDTLLDPVHFLSYLMNYGLPEDVKIVKKYASLEDFAYVLEHAPPGIFDPRSWNYWHLMCNLSVPPLPTRKFD